MIGIGDKGFSQPPVIGLAGELEYPARHRDGDAVCGELTHERVEPFPGRFACDRYAAARRNTSFSCSSRRLRLRSSRNSSDSLPTRAGLAPSSIGGAAQPLVQRHRMNTEISSDLLERHTRLTSHARHARHLRGIPADKALAWCTSFPGNPSGASQIKCHLSVQQTRGK